MQKKKLAMFAVKTDTNIRIVRYRVISAVGLVTRLKNVLNVKHVNNTGMKHINVPTLLLIYNRKANLKSNRLCLYL